LIVLHNRNFFRGYSTVGFFERNKQPS
jgi:hypothetical protein